jgi:hypothetical protein
MTESSKYQPAPPPNRRAASQHRFDKSGARNAWYHAKLAVVICLVVLFPLGLALLWTSRAFTQRSKVIISSIVTGVVALILIILLLLLLRPESGSGSKIEPTPTSSVPTTSSITSTSTTSSTTTTTTTTALLGESGSSTTEASNLPSLNQNSDESSLYFPTCAAAKAAGVAPLYIGEPGYRPGLDGDKDGKACE